MENFKKLSFGVITLIVLSVLTVFLGYISFDTVFPDYSFLRKLYYSFQLFTMESGDRFYERGTDYSVMTRVLYNAARFLAIFTLIYTIVLALLSVLKDRFFLTRVRRMSGHTILCGLGEVGNTIAQNFKNKRKLVIIESNIENENVERLRKQGVRIIAGNAFDPEILKKVGIEHASCLYALTGDDFGNLTIIRHVRSILKDIPAGNSALRMAANIDSRNLKAAASQEMSNVPDRQNCQLQRMLERFYTLANEREKVSDAGSVHHDLINDFDSAKEELQKYDPSIPCEKYRQDNSVKLFNINELAARYVFRHFPPDRFKPVRISEDPAIHILILGYSQMGEELFKQCVQNCHYINRKNTRITLLNLDSDIAENKILTKHKNITKMIDLDFIKLNPHHLTPGSLVEHKLTGVDIIYICSDNDRYQASYSVKALELFGKQTPIIRWFTRDVMSGIARSTSGNLFTIEIMKEVATHENIIDEMLDHHAIATHHRWLKRAISDYINKVETSLTEKKEIPQPKATLLPWHLLDEETRDDNRSVVEHNFIKLRTVGQLTEPAHYRDPETSVVDFSFLNDDKVVEQLAEMEHRRWIANKYYYAWNYNPARNDSAKEHDNLIDFYKLDAGTRDYDIKQIGELKEVWGLGSKGDAIDTGKKRNDGCERDICK